MPPGFIRRHVRNLRLTGEVIFHEVAYGFLKRHRRVALLVQVAWEEQTVRSLCAPDERNWEQRLDWREATAIDLSEPALRWLWDARASRSLRPRGE